MKLKINVCIAFVLIFLSACKKEKEDATLSIKKPLNYLIEINDFAKIATNPNVKIIDFRKPTLYNKEHIPNALNIWRSDIENKEYPYGGMMATKKTLEQLFNQLGITNSDMLIVYDDNGMCDAARLWWVLQNYDYTNIKLLNGGFSEWKKNDGETTSTTTQISASDFQFIETPSMRYLISKEHVLQSLSKNTTVLDTRTADEYSGKRQKRGAKKGGRIPGSNWIDWAQAINYHGDKKMKTKKELDSIYSSVISSKDDSIIVYCHSGVRSAHTTFVLTQLLGYKNVKNYDGSWTEWSYFNEYPFVQDSITVIKK
ncbi:MAG: sulfurtransferase [Flavobacteriaceae bacterium]|nr:sulfurtransferase [Flavobacteriaceae bacterium]